MELRSLVVQCLDSRFVDSLSRRRARVRCTRHRFAPQRRLPAPRRRVCVRKADDLFLVSQFFSVLVRKVVRVVLVVRWATVRRCVQVNVVRCTRRVRLPRGPVLWAAASELFHRLRQEGRQDVQRHRGVRDSVTFRVG